MAAFPSKSSKKVPDIESPAEDMVEGGVEEAADAPMKASGDHQGPNTVAEILKQETGNAVTLWANYKRYHWMLQGPRFFTLHQMFDQFAGETYDMVDDLAERLRMLGDTPPANLVEFQSASSTGVAKATKSDEMIREAVGNLECSIGCMKNGAWIAGLANDPGSVDLFSKLVQVYEKQHWFLSQMSKGE